MIFPKNKPFSKNSAFSLVLLIKTGHLINTSLNQALSRKNLTFNQVQILFLLHTHQHKNKTLSLRRLSQVLMVSLPNVTGLIDRLERDKYLARQKAVDDRRRSDLQLTPKGEKTVHQIMKNWPPPELKELDKIFIQLSKKEKEVFLSVLMKIMEVSHKQCHARCHADKI
ncbi:MAG: hypothetical protein A2233_05480 [Candidatus Kerfeldbacteria bacterium RIFOXYA2_FULL_38_24]|uniref:HTH marR-type domain-containing protein n=1 Tax=Candidatus Kerfeldbacteria bacterium RIFOXYB2_FULL_38_14 TaxID=1798547 RepID=A0A1G2BGC6_9BACT|nr:MAG: hypothetical protein A2233_05480 [Candidatus Kerfeldbacteria bacterium RIFOXYA2_FULL_38_24]OGY88278.1 MAG: hypothetical protein A2319_03765 [Candidatus Kerfeldbacteria bacterium RIFOXYB2_FULL_38_14]OGY89645.1 MAG: hypothetical protein A2458_04285 [Candidatus Kerfeldbacteria bacterium RIFOXYC2_FULL_38_9]